MRRNSIDRGTLKGSRTPREGAPAGKARLHPTRVLVLVAVMALLSAGCGTGKARPSRGLAVGLLIGLTAVAGGATAYAAHMSEQKEKDLRDDVQTGNLSGRQFADRDDEGQKWNRTARATAFVGVLGVVGLIIVGEMMLADRNQYGPIEPPASKPIIPGQNPEPPAAKLPGMLPGLTKR